MGDNIDLKKEFMDKNQEILLNNDIIDLDKAVTENILAFYKNYSINNIANELRFKICEFHGVDLNSQKGEEIYSIIINFFVNATDSIKYILEMSVNEVKEKRPVLNDETYQRELNQLSTSIMNQINEYFLSYIDDYVRILSDGVDDKVKSRIENYVFTTITGRMHNVLRDQIFLSIQKVKNNLKANKKKMDEINENTINRV